MKTRLTFLFVVVVVIANGQIKRSFPIIDKLVIPKQTMQQAVLAEISVVNDAQDTISIMAAPKYFQLKPDQQKAAVKSGEEITTVGQQQVLDDNQLQGTEKIFMLPELYYAREMSTNEQISYRILFIDAAPLRYSFDKSRFEGSIRFLPVQVSETGTVDHSKKILAQPDEIEISTGRQSIPLTIQSVNWPPLDFTVTAESPLDSFEIKILTASNPLGYAKKLPVEPAIEISGNRSTVSGLGIQTIPVYVSLKGVTAFQPVSVTIEPSLGSVDNPTVVLTGDKPALINVRSEGLGDIILTASNPNLLSNSIVIHQQFPILFILLSMLGGLIGSITHIMTGRRKFAFRPLFLGALLGLIAAVAYWGLGIVLIGFSVETKGLTEAMVFGFGLLAGFFGLLPARKVNV